MLKRPEASGETLRRFGSLSNKDDSSLQQHGSYYTTDTLLQLVDDN